MTDSFLTLKTTNIYEAAFYLLYGAAIEDVEARKAQEVIVKKKGTKTICVFTISRVPSWAVEMWRNGDVYGNITEYINARNKVKKYMYRKLYPENSI